MIKRCALFLMLLLIFSAIAVNCEETVNLLDNHSFEVLDDSGLPAGWYTDAYVKRDGFTQYDTTSDALVGDVAAHIENFDMNDARFAQTVEVEPDSMYRLSGWIKAKNIENIGHGANLSIEGVHARSESLYHTDGEWVYIETYGLTGSNQREVTVFVRLGGYSGESQGAAAFDDISLVKVDELPSGVFAEAWYTIETGPAMEQDDSSALANTKAFWPWLIVIGALYAVCALIVMPRLQQDRRRLAFEERNVFPQYKMPAFAAIGLLIALIARLIVAFTVEGYQVDVNCFTAWGNTMASVGPINFYQSNWCDYTPGYLYIIGLNGALANLLQSVVSPAFIHKLVPVFCDLMAAWLIYQTAVRSECTRDQAGLMALIFAFNPAASLNSAAWCQIDSVLCVGLMLVAICAIRRKWAVVLPLYVLCVLVKPQALMLGPLGLIGLIIEWKHENQQGSQYWKQLTHGLLVSCVVALVIILPFSLKQKSPFWTIDLYADTLGSYPYATVNTANLFYLAGANWDAISNSASTVVKVFFLLITLSWGIYTAIKQRGRQRYWLLEPVSMVIYSAIYCALIFTDCNWTVLGITTMSMAFVMILPMYVRSGDPKALPLCGAALFLMLYVFGIKMHERYLFPALFLLGLAYALRRDKRILWILVGATVTLFINEGIVLDNSIRLGSSMGHLNQDTMVLANILSVMNVCFALFSVFVCHRVCVCKDPVCLSQHHTRTDDSIPEYAAQPCTPLDFKSDAKLLLNKRDALLMLIVTLVYSLVTLTTLGSTKAPQTAWKSSAAEERIYIDLGQHYEDFSILYFAQVSYKDFAVEVRDGSHPFMTTAEEDNPEGWSKAYPVQMAEGMCFSWQYVDPSYQASDGTDTFVNATEFSDVQKFSGRYVCIIPNQYGLVLNEVIFKDVDGNIIPDVTVIGRENANENSPYYSDPSNLLDEQNTLEGEPSWWNSTYFDEIYHARTAYELLHNQEVYEWTHPPLGKIIMSWFIGIFGMTPFGWRFAGALCGILMLPAMYLLAKQLTKRTDMACLAMLLMALDCMHFTQTRLATIDSYPVLFIILSYFFMLRFMQQDIVLEPIKKLLPCLAFSGFFMGCGFASKWIGAYAGIGLAVLFFWTCGRHLRLGMNATQVISDDENEQLILARRRSALQRIFNLCLWCLLFFVVVPGAIYLLSYAKRFAARDFNGIVEFLQAVWQENFGKYYSMLSYHGTPGLGMDHYYYTPWYEWPLMIKPMYYAMAAFKPEGMTQAIFCFGNPWVWLIGLGGIAWTAYRWLIGHRYYISGKEGTLHLLRRDWDVAPAFVLIGLLAQFLPWVLVPRGTYIYHYFASIPFLILSTTLLFHHLTLKKPEFGRRVAIGYVVLCLVWFLMLFPYASGIWAPEWWMDFIRDYPYINLLPNYWQSDFLANLNNLLEKIPVFPHLYHH